MARRLGAPGMQTQVAPNPGQAAPMSVPTAVLQEGERALWSGYLLADTTAVANQSYKVFAVAQGGSGQGWTGSLGYPETNMMANNALPAGFSYAVHALAIALYYSDNTSVVLADLLNVQNHMVPFWKFLATEIEIAPARLIGAGGGAFGAVSTTATDTTIQSWVNGNGQIWLYQHYPILLAPQAQFNISYVFGPNASAIDGGTGNSSLAIQTAFLGLFNARIDN